MEVLDSSLLSTNVALTYAPRLTVAATRLKLILGIEKMSKRQHSFLLPAFHLQAQVSLKWFEVPFCLANLEDTILTSAKV